MDSELKTPEDFMRHAIELAKGGLGKTNPNPLVGAVIVKNGNIIGEGYHHAYGELHAEREALKNCYQNGENPNGATIFVTLEPCCHFGKQPPCTHALVEAKIARVIVGSRDPNPLVHGKGISYLRKHGIELQEDFLKDECDKLNEIFFHYIANKRPFVALKYAMTLDGKIATKTGDSKWITNDSSRKDVHYKRAQFSAILVGVGTVLADNPMLNCRLLDSQGNKIGTDPLRIICDSDLKIPLDCNIVQSANEIKTIVACANYERTNEEKKIFTEKKTALKAKEIEVLELPCENAISQHNENPKPQVDLKELVKILNERNIDSLLIEGGSEINYSALKSGIVDKIYAYIAPKIFGGRGKSPFSGEGVELAMEAFEFKIVCSSLIDGDMYIELDKK